ncbi:hypothetical protein LO771_27820 [Streptacidiphilus sp. ASG 303]|uniref:hypothetical protein n=1 Tax=Streptacidiphilus sp. ASG 303 TaxID=2896847 RepID=UPI001E4D0031|nr:hypothetical protein [Streptacidiphilus sp. ASG 303]MCD0486087.1 hypothetical protein [Streptacidiphilus sp. ASG 303]
MRVLVLHPPFGSFGWVNGRTFECMEPSPARDRRLSRPEADGRLARIAPVRKTDLMAPAPP